MKRVTTITIQVDSVDLARTLIAAARCAEADMLVASMTNNPGGAKRASSVFDSIDRVRALVTELVPVAEMAALIREREDSNGGRDDDGSV